ncbi:hypothetical protein C8Q80DRAFT_1266735 [Daedaleopsis nitida]|nr:hypothetical protein C8Q80DRAFT_1266735 [Daedaleopsis nitida]
MPSQVSVFIDDEDKPANIPDYETILSRCLEAERRREGPAINASGVRIELDKRSALDVGSIWVKFGNSTVTMGEAQTQRFVAQYLQANNVAAVRAPRVYLAFVWGASVYIVSEYIDGRTCKQSDVGLIAAAVQVLIDIPSPRSTPGPVGGGLIEHPFFVDEQASVEYKSILAQTGRKGHVDFESEVAQHGLRLCVSESDLLHSNFMKDRDGGIVAVDFGGYSFLPPLFFVFALYYPYGSLGANLAPRLVYPPRHHRM